MVEEVDVEANVLDTTKLTDLNGISISIIGSLPVL